MPMLFNNNNSSSGLSLIGGGVVVFILVLTYQNFTNAFTIDQFINIRTVMNNAKSLPYNTTCAWEAEELRRNWTKLFVTGNYSEVARITREFDMFKYKLCDDRRLYVCDRATAKCVCGSHVFEMLIGINRTMFVMEGDGVCKWDRGVYCLPEEFRRWPNPPGVLDSLCRSRTKCTTSLGRHCDRDYVVDYITNATDIGHILYIDVLKNWMNDKICSCI
jgi:hypothetical protein